MSDTVPKALAELGKIYAERNAVYGDDYKNHGRIMTVLFPDGLTLKTVEDFNRFSCLKEMVTKIARYAPNFQRGGHTDSLDDISVYAQMLQELDNEKVFDSKRKPEYLGPSDVGGIEH
jgi:hypothetical protein